MRKFLFHVIFLSLPILLLLIVVNFYGDAGRIFQENYEKKMVDIINRGYYVTNVSNYDERIFRKELIKNIKTPPDIIVLGSSRTLLINSEYFPGYSLINNSVSGASIQDLIGLYQLYKDVGCIPRKILMGIDPWLFNQNNGQVRWKSISKHYYKFLNVEDNDHKFQDNKYSELLSISYFQQSLKNILSRIRGKSDPVPTKIKQNISNTILFDGSLIYSTKYSNVSISEVNDRITSYMTGGIYSIEHFNSISSKNWSEFEKLVDDIMQNNIELELILVPYPLTVYNRIKKDYPFVLTTEQIVKEFSKSNGIKIYGSFDPGVLNNDLRYFYDGMHCTELGIRKLLSLN